MSNDSGITAYLHCATCLNEVPAGTSPHAYADLAIGVDCEGALVVWCNRHDKVVAYFPNDTVAEELRLASEGTCDHCGEGCGGKKETMH